MADIEFDDGAAERLIATAVITDDGIRGQGGTRASAAEDAFWNFERAYSQRFLSAVQIEAAVRSLLARRLATSAGQVRTASEGTRPTGRSHWRTSASRRPATATG